MLLLFVSAAVTIAQFRHEYGLLTTTVSATLKIDLEHGESVARYRLAAQSRGGQLRDVKVWIEQPNPNWILEASTGSSLHFPLRLWRPEIGSESDGCSINPGATEYFDLLRWWHSGGTGDLQIQLSGQTIAVPPRPLGLPLKIEWAKGFKELSLNILQYADDLQVELDDSIARDRDHSSRYVWISVAIIAAIIMIVLLSVPRISKTFGFENTIPLPVSNSEAPKPVGDEREAAICW
jgi:hypothetical protein